MKRSREDIARQLREEAELVGGDIGDQLGEEADLIDPSAFAAAGVTVEEGVENLRHNAALIAAANDPTRETGHRYGSDEHGEIHVEPDPDEDGVHRLYALDSGATTKLGYVHADAVTRVVDDLDRLGTAARIVRDLASEDAPLAENPDRGLECIFCIASYPLDAKDHDASCPWRRAVEWIRAQEGT